jgi:hypothetical protein
MTTISGKKIKLTHKKSGPKPLPQHVKKKAGKHFFIPLLTSGW